MFIFFITFFFLIQGTYSAVNTIDVNQNITDGETIVSENEIYEMGFFGLDSSKNRYLGIWFKNTKPRTVVWVANRKTPLKNTLGVVKLDNQGILSLGKVGGRVIWSSKPSSSSKNVSPVAQLLDSGNFEVRDENGVIWQSFDDPGDTYLPGMKVGKNLVTGRDMFLNCRHGEGFIKLPNMKLPDTQNAMFNRSKSVEECEVACKNNCLCIAYANNMTAGGVGCLLWFGKLIEVRVYPESGRDLYVRLAASELSDGKKHLVIIVTLPILAGLIFLGLITALYIGRKKRRSDAENEGIVVNVLDNDHNSSNSKRRSIELPVFRLSTIASATNNFSNYNKLGEGGFGPVYKGELEEGQQIAVKRLSKSSRQGLDEFKNEVICIAKLQHRNLVKLLGYCIQGDETMLVYEYMPNKSLDWFIFG